MFSSSSSFSSGMSSSSIGSSSATNTTNIDSIQSLENRVVYTTNEAVKKKLASILSQVQQNQISFLNLTPVAFDEQSAQAIPPFTFWIFLHTSVLPLSRVILLVYTLWRCFQTAFSPVVLWITPSNSGTHLLAVVFPLSWDILLMFVPWWCFRMELSPVALLTQPSNSGTRLLAAVFPLSRVILNLLRPGGASERHSRQWFF